MSASGSSVPSEEERFSCNARALTQRMVEEIDILQAQGYCANLPTHLLKMLPTLIAMYNKKELLEGFIRNSYRYWGEIYNRDIVFFRDNADEIFAAKLPTVNVRLFREIFAEKDSRGGLILKPETIEYIWNNFQAMVKISLKYIHRERRPSTYQDQAGNECIRYANPDFFAEIDVPRLATIWKVTLAI